MKKKFKTPIRMRIENDNINILLPLAVIFLGILMSITIIILSILLFK